MDCFKAYENIRIYISIPWTEKWISGSQVQVAPQEVEISSYVIGGVKQDVDADTLKGLSL